MDIIRKRWRVNWTEIEIKINLYTLVETTISRDNKIHTRNLKLDNLRKNINDKINIYKISGFIVNESWDFAKKL